MFVILSQLSLKFYNLIKCYIIRVLLLTALSCAATNIIFIIIYHNKREEYIAAIQKNTNTLVKTNELISLLKDIELEHKSYLLSGEIEHLNNYSKNIKEFKIIEAELKSVSHNEIPIIKSEVQELLISSNDLIIDLDAEINIYKSNQQSLNTVLQFSRGNNSLSKVIKLAQKITSQENVLLNINNSSLENNYEFNLVVRCTNLIFIFSILLGAFIIINRKKNYIEFLISDLKHVNQNLELLVEKRTEELNISNEKLLNVNDELFSKNELLKLNSELITLQNNYLLEINEDKNKFIGMAAHDLKNPLVSIKGLIDLFKVDKDQLSNDHIEYLSYMSEATSRMLRLISNILNVNKIEIGDCHVGLEKFKIYPFIEKLVFGYKAITTKKNINIILEEADVNLEINSDKVMLSQVIDNLVSNAIKFSPFNKNIFIKIYKIGSKIKIEVEDQGLGIQKEELPHVFDKFNRISTRPTNGEDSTGLGLSIVKGMLEDLKGKIEVESEVNKGTKFTLVFSEN